MVDIIGEELVNFLLLEGQCTSDFLNFIESRVVSLPSGSEIFWYGCYPILDDDVLIDVRVVIPEIVSVKDKLIALHEIMHAWDLYYDIGMRYEENREEREAYARSIEKLYLKSKSQ